MIVATAETWSLPQPPVMTLWDELNLPAADDAILELIHRGFEPAMVKKVGQVTGLADSLIRQALNLPSPAALNRRKNKRFTTAESDRIHSLIIVVSAAFSLFEGNREAACQWLKNPCLALGMYSPIESLCTFFGLQQLLGLIHRLEHGVYC